MARHYFDTSALLKRYLPEAGSAWLRQFIPAVEVATCEITVVEAASAFARRQRAGELSQHQAASAFGLFLSDANSYYFTRADSDVLVEAADLVLRAPPAIALRAFDAIHLAAAQRALAESPGDVLTSDVRLTAAAKWLGFSVADPAAMERDGGQNE